MAATKRFGADMLHVAVGVTVEDMTHLKCDAYGKAVDIDEDG